MSSVLLQQLAQFWQGLQSQPAWLANLAMLGICLLACVILFVAATIVWIFVLSLLGIYRTGEKSRQNELPLHR